MCLQLASKTSKSPSTTSEKTLSNHQWPKLPITAKFMLLTSTDSPKTSCFQAMKTTIFSCGTFVICPKSSTVSSATTITLHLCNGQIIKKHSSFQDQLTEESWCGTSVKSALKWLKGRNNSSTKQKKLRSFMEVIGARLLIWDFRQSTMW